MTRIETSGQRPRAGAIALNFAPHLPHIVVGIFVSGLVGLFGGAALTSWVGARTEPYPWAWFAGGVLAWVACGFLILRPSGERWLVCNLLRWEPITLDDGLTGRLAAQVNAAAGLDLREFSFYRMTADPDEVNAMSIGSRTISLTPLFHNIWLNGEGNPDRLEAILAHELGHHAGQRYRAGVMLIWLRLPAEWVIQFWKNMRTDKSGVLVRCGLIFLGVVMILLLAMKHPLALVGVLAVAAALVVLRYFSVRARQAEEFRADEFAAVCGYALPLAEYLYDKLELELGGIEERTWVDDMFGTHPAILARVAHLLPYLDDDATDGE